MFPWSFVPAKSSSIKETLSITFALSFTPVSINAIILSFCNVSGSNCDVSESSVVNGFIESLTSKLVISISESFKISSSAAVFITLSGSTATAMSL